MDFSPFFVFEVKEQVCASRHAWKFVVQAWCAFECTLEWVLGLLGADRGVLEVRNRFPLFAFSWGH